MEFNNKKSNATIEKQKEFWRVKDWFPDLSSDEDKKLKSYFNEIQKVNRELSLVSDKTLVMADVIHFSDSILAARRIIDDARPSSITDIGTGNGFPGVVIAVLYPKVNVTIIDKEAKRVEFLKKIAQNLDLKNLKVIEQGLDSLPAGSLTMVVVRAPTQMGKALLALRRQFKKGGTLYMMKGEEWATEVADIPSQLCTYWSPGLLGEYRLPIGEVKFAVVKLTKIAD